MGAVGLPVVQLLSSDRRYILTVLLLCNPAFFPFSTIKAYILTLLIHALRYRDQHVEFRIRPRPPKPNMKINVALVLVASLTTIAQDRTSEGEFLPQGTLKIIVALPSDYYRTLVKARGQNGTLARQHIHDVNELVAPFLISSAQTHVSRNQGTPSALPPFFSSPRSLSEICAPGQFCDMTTPTSRIKRSALRFFPRLGRRPGIPRMGRRPGIPRRQRVRLGKVSRSNKIKRRPRVKPKADKSTTRTKLINNLKVVYGGTGVLVMVGTLGLVTLGIADYAGWLPQLEGGEHLDLLAGQFREFAIDNAQLMKDLYYTNIGNAEVQRDTLELINQLRSGLLLEDDFTATVVYHLATERQEIREFMTEISSNPPRRFRPSLLTTRFNENMVATFGIEPQFFANCSTFRIVGFVPEKLRLYLEVDLSDCPMDASLSQQPEGPTWINLASPEQPILGRQHLSETFIDQMTQVRNHSQVNLDSLRNLNNSVTALEKSANRLPRHAIKIGIPTALLGCFLIATIAILILRRRRSRRLAADTGQAALTKLRPFGRTKNPDDANIDVLYPELVHNHQTTKVDLQSSIDAARARQGTISEEVMGKLRGAYASYHDANTALRTALHSNRHFSAAGELDTERLEEVNPKYREAVSYLTNKDQHVECA